MLEWGRWVTCQFVEFLIDPVSTRKEGRRGRKGGRREGRREEGREASNVLPGLIVNLTQASHLRGKNLN